MAHDLAGRVAWITGASSGIGRALAKMLSAKGAHVILSGRQETALQETAAALHGDSFALPFDTTEFDRLPAIVSTAADWHGRIDILVNNAGISQRSLATATDRQVYDRVIAADLLAPIHLTQACLPHLITHKMGMVVTISSVAGRIGVPLRTAYCAAKHGIIGYMDALRAENELSYGLHILNILPGSVATNVARNALTSDGSAQGHSDPQIDNGIPVDECAAEIVAAMEAGARECIIARGIEEQMALLRHSDADALFERTAMLGAHIVATQSGG
jgi:dehydrogenase/reductase SDR family member 7B